MPRQVVDSVRFVFFETHLKEFPLATNGGTAFVVRYNNRMFAITCMHVMKGFRINDLVITDALMGSKMTSIKGMYSPGNLIGGAAGSDLADICIIDLEESGSYSCEKAYDLNKMPKGISEPATRIIVTGLLKQKTFIIPPNIFLGLCFLEFTDAGVCPIR